MRIAEIILTESYADELVDTVRDLLAQLMSEDVDEIATEDFKKQLARLGFVASTEEVIQAVDRSGFASSVDANKIIPGDEFSQDVETDAEMFQPDVGREAGSQAMKDVKKDLDI